MNMDNILIIIASGKSSRFGGFPKAFCNLGSVINAQNTTEKALEYYDKIYLGVNEAVYAEYREQNFDFIMFPVVTGHGDAHSLLRCLQYVKRMELNMDRVTVCWGDAVFIDSTPFRASLNACGELSDIVPVISICAMDCRPYAWFDIDDKKRIVKSHFASVEGVVERGIHDQSLFAIHLNGGIEYLSAYRDFLRIEEGAREWNGISEMKMLYSFEYLYGSDWYDAARVSIIESGKVLSFNTQEELNMIRAKLEG